jgi:hypothetical protein
MHIDRKRLALEWLEILVSLVSFVCYFVLWLDRNFDSRPAWNDGYYLPSPHEGIFVATFILLTRVVLPLTVLCTFYMAATGKGYPYRGFTRRHLIRAVAAVVLILLEIVSLGALLRPM